MSRSIIDWEEEISSRFRHVRLMNEIELNQIDFDEITNEIREILKQALDIKKATQLIKNKYPKTFVTFLAHFSAINKKSDFWDPLGELIGSSKDDLNYAKWGKTFIEILKNNNKETFENVGKITNRYVTSIRIHGGIPNYSLNDFFNKMVMPSLETYKGISPRKTLNILLEKPSVKNYTDLPVQNFFHNSGEFGVKFFEDCINMADAYQMNGEIPSDTNLPSYISQAFISFIEQKEIIETKLIKPQILFDPEECNLIVDLPQQQINPGDLQDNKEPVWQISINDKQFVYSNLANLVRNRNIILKDQVVIKDPFEKIHVGFGYRSTDSNGFIEIVHKWILNFLPTENQLPLIAFNLRKDQYVRLIRFNQTLPPKVLLLMHPIDVEIKSKNAEIRHECTPFEGKWKNWRADYWSLEKETFFTLVRNNQELGAIRILNMEEPRLDGGRLFDQTIDPEEIPLYIQEPPTLLIPKRLDHKMHIKVEGIGNTNFDIPYETDTNHLNIIDQYYELNLRSILGLSSMGTFHINISDNYGLNYEYKFRLWPKLQINGLDDIIFPNDSENLEKKTIEFEVITHHSVLCKPHFESDQFSIEGAYGKYRIKLNDNKHSKIDLDLEYSSIILPISIPIPFLRWKLISPEKKTKNWTTSLLEYSVDLFLQSKILSILINSTGIYKNNKKLELVLQDPEERDKSLMSIPIEKTYLGDDYMQFSLNNAYDSIHYRRDIPAFSFELQQLEGGIIRKRVNILKMTRTLEISNVSLIEDKNSNFILKWEEPFLLKNRCVLIKSLWQPWNKELKIRIPDDNKGELLINDWAIPPSKYQAFFYTIPPWQSDLTPPTDLRPNLFQTIDPNDNLQILSEKLIKHPERAFRIHFERACIYSDLEITDKFEEEINFCIQNLKLANLQMLLVFYEWLEKFDIERQEIIESELFSPERLRELFENKISNESLRKAFFELVQKGVISSESCLIFLKYSDYLPIIHSCLCLLINRKDPCGINYILEKVKIGHLSDKDAIDLLKREIIFSVEILSENIDDPIVFEIIDKLFSSVENPLDIVKDLTTLSLLKIIHKVPFDKDFQLLIFIIRELINRNETEGIKITHQLFEDGFLSGNKAIELLRINPQFSYQTLNNFSQTQFRDALIAELGCANNLPIELSEDKNILNIDNLKKEIANKNKNAIHKVINLYLMKGISEQRLFSILESNPRFAYQVLLESPNVLQFQNLIVELSRKYPLETEHFSVGMLIETPAGWGKIEHIINDENVDLDIASQNEPDIKITVTLDNEGKKEKTIIDIRNKKLEFVDEKQIYFCTKCKGFYSGYKNSVAKHCKYQHGEKVSIGVRPTPSIHIYDGLKFKEEKRKPSEIGYTDYKRDSTSLFISSLSDKQLLKILLNGDAHFEELSKKCLIKRGNKEILKQIISSWEKQIINDETAINLFSINPEDSFYFMDTLPQTKKPERLLRKLADHFPIEK